MRLLYCYAEFLDWDGQAMSYRGLERFEMNLAVDARYHYDVRSNRLLQQQAEKPLPDGFWGENIYNICTLAGRNGSGKSTLLCWLRDKLEQLYRADFQSSDLCVLLFEDASDGDVQRIAVKLPGESQNHLPVGGGAFLTDSLCFPNLDKRDCSKFLDQLRQEAGRLSLEARRALIKRLQKQDSTE